MKSQKDILNSFFLGSFETEYNERLMLRNYTLPSEEILEYIGMLREIPLFDFIDLAVSKYPVSHFSTKDIPQFSSLNDGTDRICEILNTNGDNGYKFAEIGVFFRPENMVRDVRADVKYGENHCKTAADFGLVQIRIGNVCYLTCFGKIFNSLTELEKRDYLSRFVIRNRFINWLLSRAVSRPVLLEEEMSILKMSTIKRRKPNVKQYLGLLNNQQDSRIENILNNIQ